MIKSSLKYFVALYTFILALLIILAIIKSKSGDSIWSGIAGVAGVAVVLAVFLVIGLFIGMALSVLFKIPVKEKLFYWIGQFVSLALFVVLLWNAPWDNKHVNNDEENKKTIEDVARGTDGYAIKLTFNELRTQFTDPGEFYIDSTITRSGPLAPADSTAGGTIALSKDSVFNVYLVYHFPHLRKGEFYTKARVTGTVVKLEKISEDTKTSDDYRNLTNNFNLYRKEIEKRLK